jgi:hypothetical protein
MPETPPRDDRYPNICFDERARAVNKPVYVAFRGKVHHDIRFMGLENSIEMSAVADISLFKRIFWHTCHPSYVIKASGISKGIDIHHVVAARYRQSNNRRTNESRAASHQKFLDMLSNMNGLSKSDRNPASASLSDNKGSPSSCQLMPIAGSVKPDGSVAGR